MFTDYYRYQSNTQDYSVDFMAAGSGAEPLLIYIFFLIFAVLLGFLIKPKGKPHKQEFPIKCKEIPVNIQSFSPISFHESHLRKVPHK